MGSVKFYLSKEREAAVAASGKTILELIDLGLQAAGYEELAKDPERKAARRDTRRGGDCPHPPARRAKGLCMACGTYVG